jgi:hypothetical protein
MSLPALMLFCASLASAAPAITGSASAPVASPPDTPTTASAAPRAKQYSTYIGIAAGYTSGYGLSMRQWLSRNWALQVNIFPLYYENNYTKHPDDGHDSGYAKTGNGSLGLLALRRVADFRHGRIVWYSGTNLRVEYDKHDYYSTKSSWDDSSGTYRTALTHTSGYSFTKQLTIGSGAGSEFYIWRFAFHIMIGACAGYEFSDKTFSVLPSVEGGIQFRL